MESIRKWSLRLAWLLLGLVVLATLLWGLSRALYPTAAQREALALLRASDAPEGRNAFDALWALGYRVPEEEMPAVVEADRRALEQIQQDPDRYAEDAPVFRSARENYPSLTPDMDNKPAFCPSGLDDCLDRVRQDPDAYRDLVERHRELLDRVHRLGQYDHFRNRLPWDLAMPFPAFSALFYPLTENAVLFVDGRIDAALAASCKTMATWRRLAPDSDMLIFQLVGQGLVREHGRMLAEMAAKLPLDYPLPAQCAAALAAPEPSELSLCTAIKGEFALADSVQIRPEHIPSSWLAGLGRLAFSLGFDPEATRGEYARRFARHCDSDSIATNFEDRREVADPRAPAMLRLACVGNWIGCAFNEIATPAWSSYELRMRDHGAQLRLLNAWYMARLDSGGVRNRMLELLDRRLAELSHPDRHYELDRQAGEIRVKIYESAPESDWRLPLPARH